MMFRNLFFIFFTTALAAVLSARITEAYLYCSDTETCPPGFQKKNLEVYGCEGEVVCIENEKIPGCGVRNKNGSHPWFVTLLNSKNLLIGSGVLISDRYLLTAFHNVANYTEKPSELLVQVGYPVVVPEKFTQIKVRIESIQFPPDHLNPNNTASIAIVKLKESVPTNRDINPACLPTHAPVKGARCYVPSRLRAGPDSYFKEVELPVLDSEDCRKKMSEIDRKYDSLVHDGDFCAGEKSNDSYVCSRDEGAPLICEENGRFYVSSLVSSKFEGCNYTAYLYNVYNYIQWINDIIV